MTEPDAEAGAPGVPESEYDPDDAMVPDPPAGYDPATEFRYSMPVLALAALVVAPVAMALYGAVLWWAQGPAAVEAVATVTETETGVAFTVDVGSLLALFAVVAVVTVVVHELVHGVVFGRFGYDASYGAAPHVGAFYATPFHQFVRREHVPPVALAPLVVASLVGLPIIAFSPPLAAFLAFEALVFNAIGSVGDLYAAIHSARLPADSLYYDSDVRHSYVFRPSDEGR